MFALYIPLNIYFYVNLELSLLGIILWLQRVIFALPSA